MTRINHKRSGMMEKGKAPVGMFPGNGDFRMIPAFESPLGEVLELNTQLNAPFIGIISDLI